MPQIGSDKITAIEKLRARLGGESIPSALLRPTRRSLFQVAQDVFDLAQCRAEIIGDFLGEDEGVGATADAVAKALGHSSFAMTEAHYASPSSVSNARSRRVAETLGQHPPQVADTKTQLLADLLKDLTPEDFSNMLTQVRSKCGTEPPLVEIQPT